EPIHLTHPQYLVMLTLWQHEKLTVREIARLLRLEPATVSPLVKRLETLDYVTKTRSERDERIVEVTLTNTGAQLRRTAEKIPGQMMDKLGMDVDGVRQLDAVMQQLIDNVDAAAEAEASGGGWQSWSGPGPGQGGGRRYASEQRPRRRRRRGRRGVGGTPSRRPGGKRGGGPSGR